MINIGWFSTWGSQPLGPLLAAALIDDDQVVSVQLRATHGEGDMMQYTWVVAFKDKPADAGVHTGLAGY